MLKKYKTVYGQGQGEIIEKKSRFIASVKPVDSQEEAKAFIEGLKKKYWDGTHHVFAYQIGPHDEIKRCSDDGEPQGTAGKPVLDVLTGGEIKNTVIVVTRYFGGTLLGTGGLVRAYGKAAKEGVMDAQIVEKVLYCRYFVTIEYGLSGKVQYELLQENYILEDTVYTDTVTFHVLVEIEKENSFLNKITEVTGAKAAVQKQKEIYGGYKNGEFFIQ